MLPASDRVGTRPRWSPRWIGVGVLAAVLLGALLWQAVAWLRIPSTSSDEARPIAESFLGDLRSGKADRIDAAWATTTPEFKSDMGKERFRQFVRSKPQLKEPAEFADFHMTEANGLRVAECTFRTAKGAAVRVFLAPDERSWKVERVRVE